MADDDAIQRKRERLTVEMHEYFWNVCPELTARWKEAMLTLPPSVLQDLSVEIKNLEAVTKWANQQLHAALGAGGEPSEDLFDGALASMENLGEAADTMMRLLGELLVSLFSSCAGQALTAFFTFPRISFRGGVHAQGARLLFLALRFAFLLESIA